MTAVGTVGKNWTIHVRKRDRKEIKQGISVMIIPIEFRKGSEVGVKEAEG